MIEENRTLFSTLFKYLEPVHQSNFDDSKKRSVKTESAEERDWLKNCKVKSHSTLKMGRHKQFALAENNGRKLIISIGIEINNPWDDFNLQKANAGLWLATINTLRINPKHQPDISNIVFEELFFPSKESIIYYDLELIAKFFPSISIFQTPDGSCFSRDEDSIFRAAVALAAAATNISELDFTANFRRLAFQISTTEQVDFPWHLLLRALSESSWEGAFLSVYRCIEYLFPMTRIQKLKSSLALDRNSADLAASIERELGWKRKEDEAIVELFSCIRSDLTTNLWGALGKSDSPSPQAVARAIYSTRNDFVHYRPRLDRTFHESFDWPLLLENTLDVVRELHERYVSGTLSITG